MKEALTLEAPDAEEADGIKHEERTAPITYETTQFDRMREKERERIERDLHGDLGGNLSALKMLLELTWRQVPVTPQLEQRRAQWIQLIDRSIDSIHRIATNLRPAAMDAGLIAALDWLAREQTQQQEVPHRLHRRMQSVDLDPTQATALFRIAQECCNNIRKHAQASLVDIYLLDVGDSLVLEVIDNGCGFIPDQQHDSQSFGLRGMRERMRELGGEFHLASRPGMGTLVRATLPWHDHAHSAT